MADPPSIAAVAARLSDNRAAAVRVDDQGIVSLVCDLTGLDAAARGRLLDRLRTGLSAEPGVTGLRIAETEEKRARPVIVIGSGKGGVGKSTLAANLALALARTGRRIGLVDADVHGPSQPTLFGTDARPVARGNRLVPVAVRDGLSLLSMGQFADAGAAIAWRGPKTGSAAAQLIDADWGDAELLVVDLPPGTGDVQLSILQRHRPIGAIIVSTPQDLALIDARRAASLFDQAGVPVIGLVENMAGYVCPHCAGISDPFGIGPVEAEAHAMGVTFLGRVPLDARIRASSDAGVPPAGTDDALGALFMDIAEQVTRWTDNRLSQKQEDRHAADP